MRICKVPIFNNGIQTFYVSCRAKPFYVNQEYDSLMLHYLNETGADQEFQMRVLVIYSEEELLTDDWNFLGYFENTGQYVFWR